MLPEQDIYKAIGKAIFNRYSLIDKAGKYKFTGSAVHLLAGYQAGEPEGSSLQQYMHPDDWHRFAAELAALPAGETALFSPFRFRHKNGTYYWAESSVTNMLDDPDIQGYLLNSRDVTDIIETANIRNRVSTSYSNFFAKHPFGVLHMAIDGNVDMINPKLYEDLRYELVDLQNRSLVNFFLPQYRNQVYLMFNQARKQGEPETFDVQIYKKDGSGLHVNLTIVPVVYEGRTIELYCVVKDISDRYQLQESLKKISIVADKTTNGVIIANHDGVIEWVNNGFTQMNGYTLEDAIGRRTGELLQTNSSAEIRRQRIEDLEMGIPFTKEILCFKKDGTPYWNLAEVTPVFDEQNQLVQMISIHTDITERKMAEQELQQFAQDLYKRNKELQQFGYVVSHNLRSPVANIMGIANLLELDKHDPETVDTCINNLKTAIGNLDNVVRDLSLILTAPDAAVELTYECIDVTELLKSVTADLDMVIQHTNAIVRLPETSYHINSHKAYLYSIFYNLISNAIKYRSETQPQIGVDIITCTEHMRIAVADNGIGIDLNRYKQEVFKPYKRFSAGLDGKGLGLFLVKSHVEALSGTIQIESQPGYGTEFTITLPLNRKVVQNKATSLNAAVEPEKSCL